MDKQKQFLEIARRKRNVSLTPPLQYRKQPSTKANFTNVPTISTNIQHFCTARGSKTVLCDDESIIQLALQNLEHLSKRNGRYLCKRNKTSRMQIKRKPFKMYYPSLNLHPKIWPSTSWKYGEFLLWVLQRPL